MTVLFALLTVASLSLFFLSSAAAFNGNSSPIPVPATLTYVLRSCTTLLPPVQIPLLHVAQNDLIQCDQIRLFMKCLGGKFSHKRCPNIWQLWRIFWSVLLFGVKMLWLLFVLASGRNVLLFHCCPANYLTNYFHYFVTGLRVQFESNLINGPVAFRFATSEHCIKVKFTRLFF